MAFPLINYVSPELQKSPINDMISNALSGYTGMTQARYLKPTLEEALQKAKLYNQYYGPNIESQMALRKAQTGEAGARTGLLGEQMKYYGPNIMSQMALRKAQEGEVGARTGLLGEQTKRTNIENYYLPKKLREDLLKQEDAAIKRKFEQENPLFGYPGAAGQIAALDYMQKNPDAFSNVDLLKQAIGQQLSPKGKISSLESAQNYAKNMESQFGKNSNEAQLARDYVDKLAHGTPKQQNSALEMHRERMDNMALWKSLPTNAKAHAIAIGQGAGFSADETARWLSDGKSMKDLLYQHGIKDESEVEPVYQLTGAAQSQLLQRQFASKEADYLSKFIRNSTGKYARTIAGYSPKLIQDQLSGKNEEQQAKFLAARGLASEMINLRLLIANAKSSVYAQKALSEKSMLEIKNIRSLVSDKVWTRTQEVMDDTIQKMFKQAKTNFGQKNKNAEGLNKKIAKNLSVGTQENDPLGIR